MGMPVAFFEVVSQDHERAQRFYAELVPPTDLPAGYGRFAVLADPDGNAVGLWG